LTIDRAHRAVSVNGRRVRLRQKELQLLSFLADHADRYVSRDEILAAVWDDHFRTCTNTLHVHLSRLRAKLGESPDQPVFVHTCRRRGVMLAGQRARTFSPTVELLVGRPARLNNRHAA
jgi:DNA-binding response OmpR family regulator